jgi:putative hemolysin
VEDALRLLAVLALVGANAFFVIGEYAVVTARRSTIAARGGRRAAAALRLMDDPVRVISTVQVGITAVGILTGALDEPLVRGVLPDAVPGWAAFVVAFAIVTYLSVVLGELVPKALTLDRAERLALLVARPVELLAVLFKPAVWVLHGSAQLLLRPFGVGEVVAGDTIRSPDELRAMVDDAEGAGVIPRAQEEMLHNVFDFARQEARDVMTPAADVVWLPAELDVAGALRRAVEAPYSRYPVGDGSLNALRGIVHVRDIVGRSLQPGGTVGELVRDALVVPETKDVGPLLRDLREQRQHLAVVADEYGGTIGIVTMEDLLEELVGEIEDEYDLPDDRYERVDERTVRITGSMPIDDFNEIFGTRLPTGEPHTMAGLVFDALGRKPEAGDRVTVAGVELLVEEVDGARITALVVRLPG